VDLSVATYMVWGADTDVGKTLVSAGLADAAARASVRLLLLQHAAAGQKVGAGSAVLQWLLPCVPAGTACR